MSPVGDSSERERARWFDRNQSPPLPFHSRIHSRARPRPAMMSPRLRTFLTTTLPATLGTFVGFYAAGGTTAAAALIHRLSCESGTPPVYPVSDWRYGHDVESASLAASRRAARQN